MNRLRFLLLGVTIASLSGCTLIPQYTRPQAPVPATLPSGPAYAQRSVAPAVSPAEQTPWQDVFVDERLAKVIATALVNNRDLQIASLNVERAGAFYGIRRAELLPTVNASAGMIKQRVPADIAGNGRSLVSEQYGVNLGVASWEIDFFGRIRSLKEGALQEFFATERARHSAQILLVSAVANTYLTLAADRENLHLSQTTLENQQGVFDLVKRRFDRGVDAELDVHRAQGQVDTAGGDVARFTQLVALDENALNLLVGSPVSGELMPANLGDVIPPKELSPGVSSEVLLQRPDILQSENLLKAANANIGAARAAFFPRISLTAAVGTASTELSGLFKSGSGTWSYSPQIVMPIFDARTWSAVRVTKADKKIAIAQYERTIQTSFREVADALAVCGTVDQQVSAQESLVHSFGETYRLSNIRYIKGIDSYLSVLDAQRSLYGAQQGLVSVRLAKLASQVRLYAVLGGGWRSSQNVSTAATRPSR